MSITDLFYYFSPTSKSDFTNLQTNVFSINRLLKNLPYWKKPFGRALKKQKTLIVYAPDFKRWEDEKKIIVSERLESLHQQGFSIGIYVDFNKINLFNSSIFSNSSVA